MSLATFHATNKQGLPLAVKRPHYTRGGRLVPQGPGMRASAYRYAPPSDEAWRIKAIEYARWLAERDGVELPTKGAIRASWSGVYKARKSGGSVYERRINAVQWGHEELVYNMKRKDGKRGAYLYTGWNVDFEFALPNWDWQPEMTEEAELLREAA